MKFREATLADIPAMHRVRTAVRENMLSDPARFSHDDYARMLNELGRGWVCEIDSRIVGFAIANLKDSNIWALFVDPQCE